MSTSIKQMNRALYNASVHLLEAGKYLSNVDEFRAEAEHLFKMAAGLSEIMQAEPEKVSEEAMINILDEIMNFSKENK
jgi:hypothetical protein